MLPTAPKARRSRSRGGRRAGGGEARGALGSRRPGVTIGAPSRCYFEPATEEAEPRRSQRLCARWWGRSGSAHCAEPAPPANEPLSEGSVEPPSDDSSSRPTRRPTTAAVLGEAQPVQPTRAPVTTPQS